MSVEFSFDLETLGTKQRSYILAIGCVKFNPDTGEVIDRFYRNVICGNQFRIDVPTVMWWLEQSDEAREAITEGKEDAIPLEMALHDLTEWMNGSAGNPDENIVWGNGSIFDIGLLEHAYEVCELKEPWHFRNVCDLRTLVKVARRYDFDKYAVKFDGAKHHALADAEHQAKLVFEANACIEGLRL